MGGLGCPSSLYLTAAGVGTLGLADPDRVELSNLQRQVLYTEDDEGKPKVECAARTLQARNSRLRIVPHAEGITVDNAVDVIGGYDLVLDGTDNFASRLLINDAACLAGVPLIAASLFQFEAQIAIFHPRGGGPCYRCVFPEMPAGGEMPNCAEAGIFGALPGMVGSLQAMEAIKWITGCGEPLEGTMLAIDVLSHRSRRMRIDRDPACALCGDDRRILRPEPHLYAVSCEAPADRSEEIEPDAAAALERARFVDVREDFEWDICHLPGALHVPLGELENRADQLPTDVPLVIYCHHGGRSLRAVRQLRELGRDNAFSLAGGIDRWAVERDPSLARY